MVLSDHEILMEMKSGRLIITPEIQQDHITSSAVDLQLSNTFTTFQESPVAGVQTSVDLAKIENVEKIAEVYGDEHVLQGNDRFSLAPGQFVLAYTRETIKLPNYLAGRIEGRSTFARLGISIHQTAPTIHATFEGQLRLEILNNGPYECKLSAGLRICQLVLERLSSPSITTLKSLFQQQSQFS